MINRIAWAIDAREKSLRLLPLNWFAFQDHFGAAGGMPVALFSTKEQARAGLDVIGGTARFPKARIVPVRLRIEVARRMEKVAAA